MRLPRGAGAQGHSHARRNSPRWTLAEWRRLRVLVRFCLPSSGLLSQWPMLQPPRCALSSALFCPIWDAPSASGGSRRVHYQCAPCTAGMYVHVPGWRRLRGRRHTFCTPPTQDEAHTALFRAARGGDTGTGTLARPPDMRRAQADGFAADGTSLTKQIHRVISASAPGGRRARDDTARQARSTSTRMTLGSGPVMLGCGSGERTRAGWRAHGR